MAGESEKTSAVHHYRTRVSLLGLISKIKLWPSHCGILHGIRSIEVLGNQAVITTHCNCKFVVNDSRRSRAARALRNKWFSKPCPECAIPDWKIEKFASTRFSRHFGSTLQEQAGKIGSVGR